MINENIDKICLIGDDYLKYCVGASEYIVQNEEHEEYFSSENPITFKIILELIKEDKKLFAVDAFELINQKYFKKCEVYFIMGSDNFEKMSKWKDYNKIKDQKYIVIKKQ